MKKRIKACVNCGFCCTKSVCAYGVWNNEKKSCDFLEFDGLISSCNKYEEIKTNRFAFISPAFGAGCSSNLNMTRKKIIILKFNGIEQYVPNAYFDVEKDDYIYE